MAAEAAERTRGETCQRDGHESASASHRAGQAWLWGTVALTVGAVAVVVLLAPPGSARPGRALSWLLFTGSPVHVAATGWLFTLPDVRGHARRHRARYLWVPLGVAGLAAVLATLIPPAAFGRLLLPYFAWQFFHFQKQNLGMAALAASARGAPPLSPAERRALQASGWAGIIGLMARPGLLGTGLGTGAGALPGGRLTAAGFLVAAVMFGCAVLLGLTALARRSAAGRPAGFSVMYLAALLFSAPVFAFASPYAAVGGMTAAHGFQYLLLVALVAAGRAGGMPSRLAGLALLANIALIGGAALSTASHLHSASQAGRAVFGAYLGVVMAHFVVDAGLWRMRDRFPRQFLASHVPYLVRAAASPAHPVIISSTDRSVPDIGWPA